MAFFLLYCFTGNAIDVYENEQYRIQHYTEKDGLLTSQTLATAIDKYGFLWIGSFAGISRFDGKKFENFGTTNGLTEGNIEFCGYDDAGDLLVYSASNIYKYTGNKFRPFFKYPSLGKYIQNAVPAKGSNMWVAYELEKSIGLLSPQGMLQKIETQWPVYSLVKGADKEVYVLEYNGQLSVIKNNQLQPVYKIIPEGVFADEGVCLFASDDGKVWTYGANNKYAYRHSGQAIVDSIAMPAATNWDKLHVSDAGNMYTFSFDYHSLLKLEKGKWVEIATKKELQSTLYDVKEINGVLWVNTYAGFFKITAKHYSNIQASNPLVYFSTDEEQGKLILHTDSALYRIPAALQTLHALQLQTTITNVYVCSNKDVWYCTEEFVYKLPYRKKLVKLNTGNTYEGNKYRFRFRRVLEDGKGGIWISSYHGIFYLKDARLNYYYTREGMNREAINDILIDSTGIFYASGVHVYAFMENRFIDISKQLKLNDDITRLTCDANKNVWVWQGNNKAQKIAYAGNGQFKVSEIFEARVNETPVSIFHMHFDGQNNLWLTDKQSLFCFLFKKGSFAKDPLLFDEDFSGSPRLYTGGHNILQAFWHPLLENNVRSYNAASLIQSNSAAAPAVRLTDIKLFKENYNWAANGFDIDDLGVPQQPVLKHNQNFLRFSFSGLTGTFNNSISYRYQLLKYDKDWSPETNTGEAEYTGLPAGKYTFTVQVKNSGGNWGNIVAYNFTIKEVWYKTSWAMACGIMLLLVMMTGLFYWRIRVQQRRAKLKQLLLEEQLKAIRAQINPHFLQNAFAFLSQDIYPSGDNHKIKTIDKISGYFKKVLSLSDKAVIALEDELEFADEYLLMQQQILPAAFTYTIEVGEDVDVFDIQVPSMLLQPLIENAVKYGLSSKGNNKITISMQLQNEYLCCKVSDTGAGGTPLQQNVAGSGKGFLLTKERLKLFYGKKKNKPQFFNHYTAIGGFDAVIMIPLV